MEYRLKIRNTKPGLYIGSVSAKGDYTFSNQRDAKTWKTLQGVFNARERIYSIVTSIRDINGIQIENI